MMLGIMAGTVRMNSYALAATCSRLVLLVAMRLAHLLG